MGAEFPKTLYKDALYRVVHSPEEQASCEGQGWGIKKPDGRRNYRVWTAVEQKNTAVREISVA